MKPTVTIEELARSLCANPPAPADAERLVAKLLRRVHADGVKDGIRRYAWWGDGLQWAGTCGRTLAEALAEVDEECRRKETPA